MQDLQARRGRVLGSSYRLFYDDPIEVVRGEDVYLWDASGRRYLDAYNNVASVGHVHPEVVAALARQASILNTHTRYLGSEVVEYAEALLENFPEHLDRLVLTCTGSESNDLAYRIAKVATGGTGVIVTSNAYHGVTDAVASFSPSLGPKVAPGPHVRAVRAPDTYRESALVGARFAADVAVAIEDLRAHGVRPAAMFIDTVLSSDGVQTGAPGMLRPLQEVLDDAGVLLVADEVQAGFGRTGGCMWGFERHGLEPDLVTLGKPMGNGHPIGGVVGRRALMDEFGEAARYFNTYGGNTVSAVVGLAVLRVLQSQNLLENAAVTGEHLRAGLRELQARHPAIGHVRGEGLFVGVEIVGGEGTTEPGADRAARLVDGLRRRGVLISATGPDQNVLKIRPPLTFAKEHVDVVVGELESALGEQ